MNANRIAPWYRWIEYCAFGKVLERRRFAFLGRLSHAKRILVLGEGDGRMLEQLLLQAPEAAMDVVELSAEMITLARRRIPDLSRVRFFHGDARAIEFDRGVYDAVVTCFFLDCFEQKDAGILIERLSKSLNAGGTWLMSDFAVPDGGWRRWHAAVWVWTMYRFFRVTTGLKTSWLPPIQTLLEDAGLRRVEREGERWGLAVSEVWRAPDN